MTNVIYIGHRLTKDGVLTNEIFTAKPTELIERLKEKYPLIELLFVPVNLYTTAKKEVETPGTARNKAYMQTTEIGGDANG